MAEVRFYGASDDDYFSLNRASTGPAELFGVVATLVRGGKPDFSREITVTKTELQSLASWISDFWDEVPPAVLAGGRLRFIYSHREHIGEGYFDIEFEGRKVQHTYEQIGASTPFRAEQIRALLK